MCGVVRELPEHLFEVCVFVSGTAARNGHALRKRRIRFCGRAWSGLFRSWLFRGVLRFAQIDGVARINPVRILDVLVVFPKVGPSKRILQVFIGNIPKGISFLDEIGTCGKGCKAKSNRNAFNVPDELFFFSSLYTYIIPKI